MCFTFETKKNRSIFFRITAQWSYFCRMFLQTMEPFLYGVNEISKIKLINLMAFDKRYKWRKY